MCNMNMPMTKKLHNDYNDSLNNSFAYITTTNYFHMETSISSDFSIYEYIFHNIPQLYWLLPCDWYSVIIIKTNVTCQSESTICGDVEIHKVLGFFISCTFKTQSQILLWFYILLGHGTYTEKTASESAQHNKCAYWGLITMWDNKNAY